MFGRRLTGYYPRICGVEQHLFKTLNTESHRFFQRRLFLENTSGWRNLNFVPNGRVVSCEGCVSFDLKPLLKSNRQFYHLNKLNSAITVKCLARRFLSTRPVPSSSPLTSPAPTKGNTTPPKVSRKERLKQAFKEYGATLVAFHIGISILSYAGFYALVSSGVNLNPLLEFLGIASTALSGKLATGSTFIVALAVHKMFAPARISITLGSMPYIVRYLRSKGILNPKK